MRLVGQGARCKVRTGTTEDTDSSPSSGEGLPSDIATHTWRALELTEQAAREQAVDVNKTLASSRARGAMLLDIEWRLGPAPDWSSAKVFVSDVGGFAPFFRQERPLDLHFGEFRWTSFSLVRQTLNGDPHLPPAATKAEAVQGLIEMALAGLGPREALFFEGISVQGATYRLITSNKALARRVVVIRLGKPFEHQYARLPQKYEQYLQQLSSKSRQSLLYSERKLTKEMNGEVEARGFKSVDDVAAFLLDGSAISRKTYQWNLLGLGLRDCPSTRARLAMAAHKGWLRSYILYCRGLPVSFMLGYQYGGCYYYTDVGFDPVYAKWSVGSVLQLKVMQDLYQQDGRPELFDFSTGYGEHKERFGSESRLEANVLLMPRTMRARWMAASFLASEWVSETVADALDRLGLKAKLKRLLRRGSASRG